jgi:hypothetical protein
MGDTKPYGLTQMFGDLDAISLLRVSGLKWLGHISRVDSKKQ